ncbi:MAG: DUF58 domain-containing protein [Firmicutes bacterium]|nr:DUF58 domain-containing protein [Bacillota bacterium]MBR6798537.1 DUF58 domain-containing protein [Bacillota bacterium]
MMATRIGWLVLEAVMIGYFIYFGSGAAFALAIAMVLIPVLTLPLSLYLRNKIKISVTADSNVKKGVSGSFVITLENPTPWPVFRIRCRICTENQLNREEQLFVINTWLAPKGRQQVVASAGSDYCGRIKASANKVSLLDCFGIIGVSCKPEAAAYMTVQPDTFEMEVSLRPDAGTNDDSDVYSEQKPGSDMTETFQIREYVTGDSVRQIHWKLSNKFDRLIVRDPSLPVIRNVLVFWERTGETGDPDIIDAQAEIIVTLCKSLLENSIQFTVGWNDTDRNLCILHEIRDTEELVGIIPRLMRATGSSSGATGAELLLQTGEYALCRHMVYLAQNPGQGAERLYDYGSVAMVIGGENPMDGARTFDAVNYREQLHKIDI